ncbi:unnamed protein product [Ixodes pacificus]
MKFIEAVSANFYAKVHVAVSSGGVSSCCSQRFVTLIHVEGRRLLANEVRLVCENVPMVELFAFFLTRCLCRLRRLEAASSLPQCSCHLHRLEMVGSSFAISMPQPRKS